MAQDARGALTSSGYQAQLATLTALAGRHDTVILDRHCHACAYDGARLSGAQLQRFQHNDVSDLQRVLARSAASRRRIVVVESCYSMDGDEAPLAAIAACCRQHDAMLIIDEAHGMGVLGPGGRGGAAAAGVQPDLLLVTGGKSFGAQGGVVLGDQLLIDHIVNAGRAFIFSTAPAPAASAAWTRAVQLVQENPQWADDLRRRSQWLRRRLQQQGWQVPDGDTPIIPLIVGSDQAALDLSAALQEKGHFAPAIRPPTVPPGTSRVRLSLSRAHLKSDDERVLAALANFSPNNVEN